MTIAARPLDGAIAAGLAILLAAAGNTILGRRASDIGEWNEAFFVGAGAAAGTLFPLSLLLGSHALLAILGLLVGASAGSLFLPPGNPRNRREASGLDVGSLLFLGLAAVEVLLFTAFDLRVPFRWDGLAIWAGKAHVLDHDGGILRSIPTEGSYLGDKIRYPLLLPLVEALVGRIRGGWEFDALKPIFILFYASLLVGTARAARSFGSRASAAAAAALVGALPAVATGLNLGGYADLPQAAAAAAAAAAYLRESRETLSWRSPTPWLLGTLLMIKREGIFPFAAVAVIIAATLVARGMAAWSSRAAGAFVPPALFLGVRVGHLRWLKVEGRDSFPLLSQTASVIGARIALVAEQAARWLLDPRPWGLLWPAFALAAGILFVRGEGRERVIAAATILCVFADTVPFLVTTWPIPLLFEQTYPRLLEQSAPLAVIALVAARERMKEWALGLPEASPAEPAGTAPAPRGSSRP